MGRTRIHNDDAARKRAYYRRNAEKLKEKARERYETNRTVLQRQLAALERSEKKQRASMWRRYANVTLADYYRLENVKSILDSNLTVDSDCDFEALLSALRIDVKSWRGDFESDEECFDVFTRVAIKISQDGRPASVLEKITNYSFGVLAQVVKISDVAMETWGSRSLDGEEGRIGRELRQIGKEAGLLECALREILTLFKDSPETLETILVSHHVPITRMENYTFADYAKAEHADLRTLILERARAGETLCDPLESDLRGPALDQYKLWEKDLVTLLEVLEERDAWKERFERLREAMSRLIDMHRQIFFVLC
ncbi:hypothetical protein AURDEDRAFT_172350 [Auricularia subglabra TFB-10046 SS5]|nr:hypothetical protein AURDEDRAFT_172350 [Auricularia subglabra TFB-10046 SS5]